MNAVFSLLNQLSQTAWDRVTGAEQPKLYINPKGQIQETVGALTQLQEKYRPTPWLSNTHAHLLYFDVIQKRRIQLEYDHFDQLEMQDDGGVTGISGSVMTCLKRRQRLWLCIRLRALLKVCVRWCVT